MGLWCCLRASERFSPSTFVVYVYTLFNRQLELLPLGAMSHNCSDASKPSSRVDRDRQEADGVALTVKSEAPHLLDLSDFRHHPSLHGDAARKLGFVGD